MSALDLNIDTDPSHSDGRDGERIAVAVQEQTLPVSAQAEADLAAVPGGTLKQYVAPLEDDLVALFRVDLDTTAIMVAVDPYTGTVLAEYPRRSGWYDFADNIHSDLLLGVTGDRMLEIVASLGMVLIATGLYMWWPRGGGARLPSCLHSRKPAEISGNPCTVCWVSGSRCSSCFSFSPALPGPGYGVARSPRRGARFRQRNGTMFPCPTKPMQA